MMEKQDGRRNSEKTLKARPKRPPIRQSVEFQRNEREKGKRKLFGLILIASLFMWSVGSSAGGFHYELDIFAVKFHLFCVKRLLPLADEGVRECILQSPSGEI